MSSDTPPGTAGSTVPCSTARSSSIISSSVMDSSSAFSSRSTDSSSQCPSGSSRARRSSAGTGSPKDTITDLKPASRGRWPRRMRSLNTVSMRRTPHACRLMNGPDHKNHMPACIDRTHMPIFTVYRNSVSIQMYRYIYILIWMYTYIYIGNMYVHTMSSLPFLCCYCCCYCHC